MNIGDEFDLMGQYWARIHFVENPGMAFGLTFGGDYGKLSRQRRAHSYPRNFAALHEWNYGYLKRHNVGKKSGSHPRRTPADF